MGSSGDAGGAVGLEENLWITPTQAKTAAIPIAISSQKFLGAVTEVG